MTFKRGIFVKLTYPILIFIFSLCRPNPIVEETHIHLPDAEIHYNISGNGLPLILIHGSLADMSYWKNQDSLLSQEFRLVTYSRRYNYPNNNEPAPDHSAIVEANDLLGLMDALDIEKADILGHSYGAYTALWFALEHPERVRKLILAEPPLIRWLPDIPNGEGKMEQFLDSAWIPIGKAFVDGGTKAGLGYTTQWFYKTPLDSLPVEFQNELYRNAKEWKALATSRDAFPMVEVERVKKLNIPTLLLSGSRNAGKMNDLIDGQVVRLIPGAERSIIENAGHEMFLDNPEASNRAIIGFLIK